MTDLQDRMDDATRPPGLPDYEEGTAAEVLDAFEFSETEHAAWCARKLTTARNRIARVKRLADQQRAQIDAFEARETERAARDAAFFEGRLEAFHRMELERDPRNNKTLHLPDGTILRSQAGKLSVTVEDEAALLAWAEEHLMAEKLFTYADPKVDKTAIAATFGEKAKQETDPGDYPAVTEDGEVVPGVRIVRGARSFASPSTPEVATEAAPVGDDDE